MSKMGRPSKFKEEYCKKLVKHMSEGFSFETFGAQLGVGKTTLYRWRDEHPSFKEALEIGQAACQDWWERAGREGMFMGGKDNPFQSSIWNFNMAARFRWSNKVEQKVETTVKLEDMIDQSFDGEDE